MLKTGMKIEASSEGKKGVIRIVDMIAMHTDSSSTAVRAIVDKLIADGVTEAEVYISSRGGSTIEAVEIANELNRLPKVVMTVGAVAASAATYLLTKFYAQGYANSQFMVHAPRLTTQGNIEQVQADLRLLENTTEDYLNAYAQKMKKTKEDIEAIFKKGDYWMTANEAKAMGLIDDIILGNELEITALDVDILTACSAPSIPEITFNNSKMKNRNQIIASLKLSADATDEQIEQAVNDAMTKAAKVDAMQLQTEKLQTDQVKAMVAAAHQAKKITADLVPHYEKLATNDFDSTKAILDSMPTVDKASAHLDASSNASGRANWTLEEYQEKDPNALLKMMSEDPTAFAKLEDAYFAKN
jgi:ATP-dependent protease ClpP protease subunit